MSRQHKIWVEASGGSSKSFGCGDDDIRLTIYVGSSASHSKEFARIRIEHGEHDGKRSFHLVIDGQDYKHTTFDLKTKEFGKVVGRKINGNPRLQAKREKEKSEGMFKALTGVMMMGEVLCDKQAEKNDWKARMLKAGLPEGALHMPEDWGTLSEDEKERRLNGVMEILSETPKS